MKKIVPPILIVFLLVCSVFAQTAQTITLKPGFNFVSFTSAISLTPVQLKTQNQAVEDVYLFSAAAGSFLSANDGTLSTLAAGKGYIVKSSATSDTPLSISGDAIQTTGNINIKTGFNLIGFSKIPSTTSTFKSLMNIYTSIKGIYKWSPAAGSFIQVVRDNSGAVTLLDGADPSFKAGESYFFNLTEDTTINYDGTDIILGSGPPAPVAKTLEITGTVGVSTTTAPSYSVARAIDLSTMQLSVYDEINNANVEGAVVTATGAATFKATLPVAIADRYLSVLVKNADNKVVYKSFLGRVPKATEVTENTVKISNIKVSDESTARAIIVLENRAKIPVTAVIAKTSVDASIAKTDFALALEEHIAGLEDRVPELKLAVNLIANVLTTAGVDAAIKQKVTEFTFSESSKLLSSYVSLLQDANTLQTVNNISVPTQLNIGSKQITAQSSQVEIYETVAGLNDTIGQRVEMPVLNPPPGRYDNPISITMTCATPNANIVYDYGDGNPGITYTAPVSINKTCTLNIAGFRSDWPMSWHSKFVNATYTIGPGTGGETTETRVLSLITLDRTSEAIVVTAEKYYLSNVKISAHYSNGDSKEIQATRWEMVSAPGSFSDSDNSYYLWNKTGDAVFNAVYSENGIEKKIEFKLMVRTQEELGQILKEIKPVSESYTMASGGMIYLPSLIKIDAYYYDGTTKEVAAKWKFISGIGSLSDMGWFTAIIAGSNTQETILKAEYSEGDVTATCEYKIIVPGGKLSSLKLNQIETVIKNGDKYDLSQIKAVATYSGGGTKEVEIGKWDKISGTGNMLDKTFNSEIGSEGMSIVSGTYIDGDVSKSVNFYISITSNIVNNSLRTGISDIKTEYIHPVSGGSITLGDDYRNQAELLIYANSITKPVEFTLAKFNHSILYPNQELYTISANEPIENLSFGLHYADKNLYPGGKVKLYYIDPISGEYYLLKTEYSPYGPKNAMTDYSNSGRISFKAENKSVMQENGTRIDLSNVKIFTVMVVYDSFFYNTSGVIENIIKCLEYPYYKQKGSYCFYSSALSLIRAYDKKNDPVNKLTYPVLLQTFKNEEFKFESKPYLEYERYVKSTYKYILIKTILNQIVGEIGTQFYFSDDSYSSFLNLVREKINEGIPIIFNSTKSDHSITIVGIDDYNITYHSPNSVGYPYEIRSFEVFKNWAFPDNCVSFFNSSQNTSMDAAFCMFPTKPIDGLFHRQTVHAYDDAPPDGSEGYVIISAVDQNNKRIWTLAPDGQPVMLKAQDHLRWQFKYNIDSPTAYSIDYYKHSDYKLPSEVTKLLKHDVIFKLPIYNTALSKVSFYLSITLYNDDINFKITKYYSISLDPGNQDFIERTISGEEIKNALGTKKCPEMKVKISLNNNSTETTPNNDTDGFEFVIPNYPE